MAVDGLVMMKSMYGPSETTDRLTAAVVDHGMTIVARIDHAAAAAKVGLELRPTELLVFGDPKAGTPLMQAVQTVAIDLPLRALVWRDEQGGTWLGYNDPRWLAKRHDASAGMDGVLDAMARALASVATAATT